MVLYNRSFLFNISKLGFEVIIVINHLSDLIINQLEMDQSIM